MVEERKEARWNMLLFLPVHNQENGEFIGYIVDIARHGILVFSPAHIEMGRVCNMVIYHKDLGETLLSDSIQGDISFEAQSRWIDMDAKPVFHRTGFMFHNLSEETEKAFRQLVRNVANKWEVW